MITIALQTPTLQTRIDRVTKRERNKETKKKFELTDIDRQTEIEI